MTVFLFSLIDARIFEKGQKRKKNGVEMSASKKSVETDAVKKEDEKVGRQENHDAGYDICQICYNSLNCFDKGFSCIKKLKT